MTVIISKGLYDELTDRINTNKALVLKETELMYINHARLANGKPLTKKQLTTIKNYVKNLFEGV